MTPKQKDAIRRLAAAVQSMDGNGAGAIVDALRFGHYGPPVTRSGILAALQPFGVFEPEFEAAMAEADASEAES